MNDTNEPEYFIGKAPVPENPPPKRMIYAAMQAVMKDIGYVGKDKKNQAQGFKFRGVDDVMNALHGPLSKHGVFITSTIIEETRSERASKNGGMLFYTILRVTYTFHALDGSSISTTVIGEAMDSADKSTSKALSIAFKYAMMQVFSIPTEEQDDPDAEAHDVASTEERVTVQPFRNMSMEEIKNMPRPGQAVKKEVKNHAPGISPMQQVSAAISRHGRDRELVGRWIRRMYPTINLATMSQNLADVVIQKIVDTPDEGFDLELKDQG